MDGVGRTYTFAASLDELWCLHKYMRRPREQEGQEFDKGFMLQVYRGIAANGESWELECAERDLWGITRLVDMDYSRGGKFTGHNLLIKVIAALAEESPDALLIQAQEVLNGIRDDYDHAGTHDGAGNGAGH